MNNAEFIKEIHEYIDEEYAQFCEYQKIVLEILSKFCLLCEDNEINYAMAYGTLLGAIRDHGQIPWDYDIDVFVPNFDRAKLLSVLDSELGEDFFYTYKTNMPKYPATCLRICKRGYTYMALHVDVFFLVGCPADENDRNKFIREVSAISIIRMQKYIYSHIPRIDESRLKRLYHFLAEIKTKLISTKYLVQKEERLFEKFSFGATAYCMAFADDPICYPTAWFLNTDVVEFGDLMVRVPQGHDSFLTKKYKDYSTYLPIKDRFKEFINMKAIVDNRQSLYKH